MKYLASFSWGYRMHISEEYHYQYRRLEVLFEIVIPSLRKSAPLSLYAMTMSMIIAMTLAMTLHSTLNVS